MKEEFDVLVEDFDNLVEARFFSFEGELRSRVKISPFCLENALAQPLLARLGVQFYTKEK
jgi:hypothetical protein